MSYNEIKSLKESVKEWKVMDKSRKRNFSEENLRYVKDNLKRYKMKWVKWENFIIHNFTCNINNY